MAFLSTVVGLAIVALALVDLLWTTIAAGSGGGPLTRRLGAVLWRGALALHARRPGHGLLASAGPVIVFSLFLSWVATVLAGWCLVFLSTEDAVRESSTGLAADVVDRIYFTGYTVFTLGIGDYRPGDGVWQLLTVAATGTGLVLVTVGITYLVGVASAVTERRQLASSIAALGDNAESILVRAWNGRDFGALRDHLVSLTCSGAGASTGSPDGVQR